jgi:hypothetical protein
MIPEPGRKNFYNFPDSFSRVPVTTPDNCKFFLKNSRILWKFFYKRSLTKDITLPTPSCDTRIPARLPAREVPGIAIIATIKELRTLIPFLRNP